MKEEHNNPQSISTLLTRIQVAKYFQVTVRTIDNWTKEGLLIATKVGRKVYYLESEILKTLQRNL